MELGTIMSGNGFDFECALEEDAVGEGIEQLGALSKSELWSHSVNDVKDMILDFGCVFGRFIADY
jgi:hypothetical protein